MFCAHYRQLQLVGLHAHLNTLFAHVTLFNGQFNLIEEREACVLAALWQALVRCAVSKPRQPAETTGDDYAEAAVAAAAFDSNKENIQVVSPRVYTRPT